MGISKTYLDSSYLLAMIKEEGGRREIKNMLYKLRSNAFDVFVPHVVLGEICGVILRDFEPDRAKYKISKLVDIMTDNKIEWKNMKPTQKGAFNIMTQLSRKDKFLDTTDIIIVSHVLSDPDSKFFFTTDSYLLENRAIIDLEKKLSNEGKRHTTLKISDVF